VTVAATVLGCATSKAGSDRASPAEEAQKPMRNQEEETVRTNSQARRRRVVLRISGLSLMVAFLPGCGCSSGVQEIPEASRKLLIQRKVDVEQGNAKAARTGQAPAQGRTPTQKP
jgi:hypothetical protein